MIAAQIERYARQISTDIAALEATVARCSTRDKLRATVIATWERMFAERPESRWRRTNVVGNAYARPALEAAVAEAHDEIVLKLVRISEPCRERGWLRDGIDLVSAVAWQHTVLLGRVFIEHGMEQVDPAEWDRLTIEALDRAFFGP